MHLFLRIRIGDSFEGYIEDSILEDIKVVKVAYLRWNFV